MGDRNELLINSCKESNLKSVMKCIKKSAFSKGANVNYKDAEGNTPLFYAVRKGSIPIVEYLLSQGANIDQKDNNKDLLLLVRENMNLLDMVLAKLDSYEVDMPNGYGLCSDRNCPCPETRIEPGNGYIYTSEKAARYRKSFRTLIHARDNLYQFDGIPRECTAILVCEKGARLRKLDLAVASEDAKMAWAENRVPCRPTPIEK